MNVPAPPAELAQALAAVRPHLRTAGWFSAASALLVLAPGLYMLEVYDRVVNSRNLTTLVMLTVLVLFAFAVMELLDWARLRVLQQAGASLDRRIGERVFTATFDAGLRRRPSGTAQPLADLRTLREFIASPPVLAAMESPAGLVFLAVLVAVHPLLAVAALAGALVQVGIGWANERAARAPLAVASQAGLAATRYAESAQVAAQAVAAMGMQPHVERRWLAAQGASLQAQASAGRQAATWHALSRFVQVTLGSLIIGLGAWLVVRNELPRGVGVVILASILGARLLAPLVIVVTQWRLVLQFREAWARVAGVLQDAPAAAPAMPLPTPQGALQVDHAVVCAPGQAVRLLKDVSFALKPGEVLAVLGPSGAGKTCLARALVGLWPCDTGKVRLDRADVFGWDKEQLGRHVGYLPQDVELFDGTLADNIARFGVADPARLEAAAADAGLHEWVEGLPQRYDTPIGAEGMRLSGGQRQRVALARALYGDPVLLVLDEPDASLDEAGDAALAAAVRTAAARGATCVIVTQRRSVLALADQLLVLRDGEVQACGARDTVLRALLPGPVKVSGAPKAPRRTVRTAAAPPGAPAPTAPAAQPTGASP